MESPNESLSIKDGNLNTVREPQESTEVLRNIDSIEGSRGNFDGTVESPELYTYIENLDENCFPRGNVGNFQMQDNITLSPAHVPTNLLVPPPPPPTQTPTSTSTRYEVTESLNYPMACVASTSTASSSNENEESMVSPADISGELATPNKKRGRKPNSGTRIPPTPKPEKPKKGKVYEIDEPYADKEMERKRRCAITSKKHRDNNKREKEQRAWWCLPA